MESEEGIELEEEEIVTRFQGKPTIEFSFKDEAALKEFMKNLALAGVISADMLCLVKNVKLAFFEGFNDILEQITDNKQESDLSN